MKLQEMITDAATKGAAAAIAALPPLKSVGVAVSEPAVTHDEADNPFTSIADNLFAVKNWQLSGGQVVHPRLKAIKAVLGGNEATPSEGGYLLEPTIAAQLLMDTHEAGPFTSAVFGLPVGTDSNYGWINGVDETSRADGSRWGGRRAYWTGEAASLPASKPEWGELALKLNKLTALFYATDEMLEDSVALASYVNRVVPQELAFKLDVAILNGTGAGQPLGVLRGSGLSEVTKETNQAAATIVYENIIKMRARIWGYGKAIWMVNHDTLPQLMLMNQTLGTAGVIVWQPSAREDHPDLLFGRPLVISEYMQTLGTKGDILLANWSEYLEGIYQPYQSAESIHVRFVNHERTFKFWVRNAGAPWWNAAFTPKHSTATLSPFVTLDTRA